MFRPPRHWLHSTRYLAKDRWLTILVTACLTIGIGATTTVFSLVDSLLLRTPPGVHEPEQLVTVTPRTVDIPGFLQGSFAAPLSWPHFQVFRDQNDALTGLAAHHGVTVHLALGTVVERARCDIVSDGYFALLGAVPAAGRLLNQEDGVEEAVISHRLWRIAFGGDPAAVGRVIRLNGSPFTIVGVTPEGFVGSRWDSRPDIWVQLAAAPWLIPGMSRQQVEDPSHGWLFSFVGRLAPGRSVETAQERMDAIAGRLRQTLPQDQAPTGLVVHPGVGIDPAERGDTLEALAVLLAAALFLLLIACLDAALLLLSRVPRRASEVVVRLALGAPRHRLVRQFLTESVILGLLGGCGGVFVSYLATRALPRIQLAGFLPDIERITVDARTLCFAVVSGIGASLVAGLAPALRSTYTDIAQQLKRKRGTGRSSRRFQEVLIVLQIAVALALLVATGLLVRSFRNHQAALTGFDADTVINVRFDLERQGYGAAEGAALQRRLLDEVRSLIAVEEASLATSVPLLPGEARSVAQIVPVTGASAATAATWVTYNVVGPGYLRTLGIPLRTGRDLTREDRSGRQPVVVINESLAKKFWPHSDAVGQRLQIGGQEAEVVGIAANVRTERLKAPPGPHFYRPLFQEYRPVTTLHVRAPTDPASLLPRIEQLIGRLDPTLPVFDKGLFADQLATVLARPQLAAGAVGLLSLLGLILAGMGICGVMLRSASDRLKELGIRLALGARRTDVRWLIVRRGFVLTIIGTVWGLVLSLALARTLGSFLYGLGPYDPWTLIVVTAVILAVGVLSSSIPADRAARTDPADVLRHE